MTRARRPIISDDALLAAWAAVPEEERLTFVCEVLSEEAAEQLLRAQERRHAHERPAPRPGRRSPLAGQVAAEL